MARPPRIEFAGAVYHVSSRCDTGKAFVDDTDREAFLQLLAQAMQRFDAQVLAYCLLPDHFELLLFTRQANLSRLMRHLNGVYTQHHNRRHGDTGALFHGRFKAVLVDRDALLLDVCRYVELTPVRLGLAASAQAWPWSSHRAHAGTEPAPAWLDADGLHSYVLGKPVLNAADRRRAGERYAKLVASEPKLDIWAGQLRQQIFLGDAKFAARMLARTGATRAVGTRRKGAGNWNDWMRGSSTREQALYRAHTEGGLSMTALAGNLGLSVSRVSRLIKGYEQSIGGAHA